VRELIVSLRPRQWAKNLLVFAGLVFGYRLFDIPSVVRASAAFAVFCTLSSAVYLVNDVVDRPADRIHPLKALRPIASGAIDVRVAWFVATLLAATSLAVAVWLDLKFGLIALAYALLMVSYVSMLKHVVVADVCAIGLGFALRAWAGAAVIHVPVSRWLLIVTLFLAMFLSLTKRRAELSALGADAVTHRRVLRAYNSWNVLDILIAVVTGATLVTYALYTVSPDTIERFGTTRLLFTLPFPVFGVVRYLFLVYRGRGGADPSEHLLSDVPLLASVALWIITVTAIIYRPSP
jgi:4-hydroxybenzoate polyprenyltransferase